MKTRGDSLETYRGDLGRIETAAWIPAIWVEGYLGPAVVVGGRLVVPVRPEALGLEGILY